MVNTSIAKGTVCVRAKDEKTLEEIYYLMNDDNSSSNFPTILLDPFKVLKSNNEWLPVMFISKFTGAGRWKYNKNIEWLIDDLKNYGFTFNPFTIEFTFRDYEPGMGVFNFQVVEITHEEGFVINQKCINIIHYEDIEINWENTVSLGFEMEYDLLKELETNVKVDAECIDNFYGPNTPLNAYQALRKSKEWTNEFPTVVKILKSKGY